MYYFVLLLQKKIKKKILKWENWSLYLKEIKLKLL